MKQNRKWLLATIGAGIGAYSAMSHHLENKLLSRQFEGLIYDDQWLRQVKAKDIWIQSSKMIKPNIKLHGVYITNPDPTHQYVLIVHGYQREHRRMQEHAKGFYDQGYHVVMVDLRAHGQSEGQTISMGWKDRYDIVEWCQMITQIDKDANIVILGMSMGGATVMNASSLDLPNVIAIIEDCGFSSIDAIFKYQLKNVYKLNPILVPGVRAALTLRLGIQLKDASSLEQIQMTSIPMMFIHGSEDQIVPVEMAYALYDKCASAIKTIQIYEGINHSGCVQHEDYFKNIFAFIEQVKQRKQVN